MKKFNLENRPYPIHTGLLARSLLVAGLFFMAKAGAQSLPQPGLAIAPVATNQFSVTFTNAVSGYNYELWWVPVLGSPNYLWAMEPPGSPGQTNFILANSGYPAVFFRGVLDTNNPPLWENATPNSPGTNLLKVTIASPANGSVLQ